jgi:hypothetical protein
VILQKADMQLKPEARSQMRSSNGFSLLASRYHEKEIVETRSIRG